ncbi:hypothetical protein B5V01_26595 [Mesorhizobium erdmanii]|uniref:Transposase n=2 Tax=Mesorhizobium TaxID=68287 RepID=A0A3M9X2Z0_9HYPH|nr:hypothetical protein DNR46_29540 [Mesorhizobium japonicum]RXT39126.1 hypothetical protein B5V01_26595 [Mesorhizobium erdmanii]
MASDWASLRFHSAVATKPAVTLFDSIGFATEVFSALRYVRDQLVQAVRPATSTRIEMYQRCSA